MKGPLDLKCKPLRLCLRKKRDPHLLCKRMEQNLNFSQEGGEKRKEEESRKDCQRKTREDLEEEKTAAVERMRDLREQK